MNTLILNAAATALYFLCNAHLQCYCCVHRENWVVTLFVEILQAQKVTVVLPRLQRQQVNALRQLGLQCGVLGTIRAQYQL